MRDDVQLLAGCRTPERTPWVPFDPRVTAFLAALSQAVRQSPLRQPEEVAAFGFWCRKAHLDALAARHAVPFPRLGRGLLFHLAPANVPTMFAYSLVIGLLAGNANLVRVSQRGGGVEAALCALWDQVLARTEFAPIKKRVSILTYPRDSARTAALLADCDGRVIWGGDATIAAMRAIPMPPHAVELCFPDRYSMALFSQKALSELEDGPLAALAHRFYNDAYLMDQRACSSPQLVLWLEDGGVNECRARWWRAVADEAAKQYELGPYQAARKYESAYFAAMTMTDPAVARLCRYGGNLTWVARLDAAPRRPIDPRGGFGLFYECGLSALEDLLPILSPKVQTLSCGGLDTGTVAAFLAERRAAGVDRVVPLGQALEMDSIWDGKDLIGALSRIVSG